MKLDPSNIGYFGLDHLELILPKNKFLFEIPEINATNTPEAYIDLGQYHFRIRLGHTPPQYEKNIVFELQYVMFDDDSFILTKDYLHAFSYLFGKTSGVITTRNKLVIHSTFFAYMTKEGCNHLQVYDFISRYICIDSCPIHRGDIALDILDIPREQVVGWFDPQCFSAKIGKRREEKIHQTHYIANYEKTKNRNYLVRIYDKIEDTRKKQKSFLFGHYGQHKHVTRIEIELRSLFFEHVGKGEQDSDFQKFREFTIKDLLLDTSNISSIMKEKLGLYSTLDLGDLAFHPYSKNVFPLKQEYLKNQHIPKTYMQRFLGYSKNILDTTGPNGYAQAFFGVIKDKRKKRQVTQYKISELKLLESMLQYFFHNFPQHKKDIIEIISKI